jgi:hypothetical protein
LRGDITRSPASFSVPQTYWSIVTSTFLGGGTAPVTTTLPLSVAAGTGIDSRAASAQPAATNIDRVIGIGKKLLTLEVTRPR